jgi:hypothetical protein
MPNNTSWGELLVGAYHQLENECEVVSYNNRSEEPGNQMEADVLAIDNDRESGERHVYICEVVTHLKGNLYSGSPKDEEGWWMEYSNTSAYHRSLEKLWRKFSDNHRYVRQTFPHANEYSFEFWAPVVKGSKTEGPLIKGLNRLSEEFEKATDEELELFINEKYTARIDLLREKAKDDTSGRGAPAYRFLQILEHLR